MSKRRQSIGNFVTNWGRDDLSFGQKLRMQLKNTWIRVRTRSNCCGNDGEPGC
jgi:hypothetical protein